MNTQARPSVQPLAGDTRVGAALRRPPALAAAASAAFVCEASATRVKP